MKKNSIFLTGIAVLMISALGFALQQKHRGDQLQTELKSALEIIHQNEELTLRVMTDPTVETVAKAKDAISAPSPKSVSASLASE